MMVKNRVHAAGNYTCAQELAIFRLGAISSYLLHICLIHIT